MIADITYVILLRNDKRKISEIRFLNRDKSKNQKQAQAQAQAQ